MCIRDRIKSEIDFLNLLKASEIPVSYPIEDNLQGYIQTIKAPEGKRYGVLFSFAPGEKTADISNDLHHKIGALMAQMHQESQGLNLDRTQYDEQTLIHQPLEAISKFLSADSDEMKWLKARQKELTAIFSTINMVEVRTGTVHLDFWYDNLNITEDEGLSLIHI